MIKILVSLRLRPTYEDFALAELKALLQMYIPKELTLE